MRCSNWPTISDALTAGTSGGVEEEGRQEGQVCSIFMLHRTTRVGTLGAVRFADKYSKHSHNCSRVRYMCVLLPYSTTTSPVNHNATVALSLVLREIAGDSTVNEESFGLRVHYLAIILVFPCGVEGMNLGNATVGVHFLGEIVPG